MKSFILFMILFSSATFAKPYVYNCVPHTWNGSGQNIEEIEISVTPRKATAVLIGPQWNEIIGGNINNNFRSEGRSTYVKFGNNLIIEKTLLTGGHRLRDGNWGGFARVEGTENGQFYRYKFTCRLK